MVWFDVCRMCCLSRSVAFYFQSIDVDFLILDLWFYPVGCCFFLDLGLSFIVFARTIFSHMALTTTCETRSFSLSFLILVGFVELLLRPWVLCLLLVGVVFLGLVILVFSECSCTSIDGVQSFCS